MNIPARIEIIRTETFGVVRYWVGAHALTKNTAGEWAMFPYGDMAERPMFTADTLEACMDMTAGAVALMQPAN